MSGLSLLQRRVVETLDEQVFVAAGAGAGKTLTLVQRLAYALTPDPDTGVAPLDSLDHALVITFTRRAADEVKGRLRTELMARGYHEEALRLDDAWVSTIHGMCERILKESALELGLDPGFGIVQGHREEYLRSRAVREVLADARESEQYRALFDAYGADMRAAADAGVQTQPGRRAAKSSAPEMAEQIFRRAASSVKGFAEVRFGGGSWSSESALFELAEAYGRLVEVWAPKKGTKGVEYRAACEASQRAVESELLSDLGPQETIDLLEGLFRPSSRGQRDYLVKDAIGEVGKYWSAVWAQAQYELKVRPHEATLMRLAHAFGKRYDAVKREEGVLDQMDLLRLTLDALQHNPGVQKRYRGRFSLVMVDEFQDTDPQQLQIVHLLASSPNALCYVGDGQQSIYRFRGASMDQYQKAKAAVSEPVQLACNYRSHRDILRFVSKALGESGILSDFMYLNSNPERVDEFGPKDVPRVCVEHTTSADATLEVLRRRNAEQMAERLQELHKQGVPLHDMALLLRSLSDADMYMEALRDHGLEAVMTKGSTFSQAPEVRMVQSLLVALANPRDTHLGLLPVLQGPLFALSEDELALLAKGGRSQSVVDGVMAGPENLSALLGEEPGPRVSRAVEVLARARERMGTRSVADTVLAVCTESGWLARLEREGAAGRARAANVLAAVRRIREVVDEEGVGFSHAPKVFGDWLASAKQAPAAVNAQEGSALSVMTVHGSKGLEFPVVAVAGCFDDSSRASRQRLLASPSSRGTDLALMAEPFSTDRKEAASFRKELNAAREIMAFAPEPGGLQWRFDLESQEAEQEAQEAARILYVALTRARDALVLGMVTKTNKEGVVTPELTERLLEQLLGGVPHEEGTEHFDYGGSYQGEVRTSLVSKPAESTEVEDEAPAEEPEPPRPFLLFEEAPAVPAASTWRLAHDVRSYSSDKHQAEVQAALEEADGDEGALESWQFHVPGRSANPATAFGDAFHELARWAADRGSLPPADRVEAVARLRSVEAAQLERLQSALAAWWGSSLCQEAFSWPTHVPEAPFFSATGEADGGYLTGSIDLLCTDDLGNALVVDYKTGERRLSAEEALEHHEMQARYYAHVLLREGYRQVSCAFVLVENIGPDGEPLTVRFSYDAENPPALGPMEAASMEEC